MIIVNKCRAFVIRLILINENKYQIFLISMKTECCSHVQINERVKKVGNFNNNNHWSLFTFLTILKTRNITTEFSKLPKPKVYKQ